MDPPFFDLRIRYILYKDQYKVIVFFQMGSAICYGSKTAQIVCVITFFHTNILFTQKHKVIRDCISLALIKIRQSKCQFQSVCKVHSGVLFKRGEYT